MRFIHTSDWHLGRSLHGEPLLDAQERFLHWLVALARERAVDAVVVAGDVYDRAVPALDAVALLNRTLVAFVEAAIPIVLTSGNHDSAIRLAYGDRIFAAAGVHLRTAAADLDRPVVIADEHGDVGIYGIPYLLPDAAMVQLEVSERSHFAVLSAATARIRADAERRGLTRTVIAAHAFVTGGQGSESERDIRIGGIGDTSVRAFTGASYVALGHLHGPQRVSAEGAATTARYSGSPLAFSFSERHHTKSVALVELDAAGRTSVELVPTPVTRPLREVRGGIQELIARSDTDLADLREAWVKAIITDPGRPAAPMEKLRAVWPHTLVLDFAPERGSNGAGTDADADRLARAADPVDVCASFLEWVDGTPATKAQRAILLEVVEAAARRNAARDEVA